jgi:uncharacterized protein YxjI
MTLLPLLLLTGCGTDTTPYLTKELPLAKTPPEDSTEAQKVFKAADEFDQSPDGGISLDEFDKYRAAPANQQIFNSGQLDAAHAQLVTARSAQEMPAKFELSETRNSYWNPAAILAFNVQDDHGGYFGYVQREMAPLHTIFHFKDPLGNEVASAQDTIISVGNEITVTDNQGQKLGTIEEHVIQSLLSAYTNYAIKDPSGNTIAISEKVQLLATTFTISKPDGTQIATLSRPGFRMGESWSVHMSNDSIVDGRILVMIGAFKSYADILEARKEAADKKAEDDDKKD